MKAVHMSDTPHTSAALAWLSQGDAAARLTAEGDAVSRTALVRYLGRHTEIPRRSDGPGHPVFVDYDSLKAHRAAHAAARALQASSDGLPSHSPAPQIDSFAARSRIARIEKEEHDARRARVLADEAEGRVVLKADAARAFSAIGTVLAQWFETNRRIIVSKLREAADQRAGETMMRNQFEPAFRRQAVQELSRLMSPPADAAQAAE